MGITGKNRRKIVLATIVTVIILLGYGVYRLSRHDTGSVSQSVSTFPVSRGDLMMSVTESGTIKAARVAMGAVGPTPIVATTSIAVLEGNQPTDKLFAEAARAAAADAKPITDIRGSEEYRRDIVEVLTRRALAQALQRARGEEKAGA